jgi:hypothetical protein
MIAIRHPEKLDAAHVLAMLRAVGPQCHISGDELGRAVAAAVFRYQGRSASASETLRLSEANAHLRAVRKTALKLVRLIEGTAENRRLINEGMLALLHTQDERSPSAIRSAAVEGAEALAAVATAALKAPRPPTPKADAALNDLLTDIVGIYEKATGRQATFTFDAVSGDTRGAFVEFWDAATVGAFFDAPPTPAAIRTRLRRLRYAQPPLKNQARAHSQNATEDGILSASKEVTDANNRSTKRRNRTSGGTRA